jgi:chemotaxis protein methyltransferase CheR
MTETISPSLREDFVALIAKQTGIEIRAQNYGSMGDNIFTRMKALKLVSPQAYYNLLASFSPDSEEEWQKFVCLVTNRESYFFRDIRTIFFTEKYYLTRTDSAQSKDKNFAGLQCGLFHWTRTLFHRYFTERINSRINPMESHDFRN